MFFIKVFSALYPLNGSRNRRFVEKASSVAAESERARRFRDARAFSGIAATAARKRMSGVDGMEMSVRAAQEAKHRDDGDGNQRGREEEGGIGEGERRERRDGRRGTARGKQGEEDTTSGGEEHRGTECTRAESAHRGRDEGEKSPREEPPLVPASTQTNGPSPDAEESRTFCAARSSLHLRTDPLIRCHRTLRSVRSLRSSSA